MKYIYFIILAVMLFSCNNWDKNPVKVEETERAVSGLIYKSNFPNNTSDFYAFKDDLWILGTSDGGFYKSTDKGNSWTKKGEMKEKDKVNSMYAFSEKIGGVEQVFMLAGTEKGIYISKDKGESWKEAIISSEETGEYIQTCFFGYEYNKGINKLTINAYGWDGKNSNFTSTDDGNKWIGQNKYSGKYIATTTNHFSWNEVVASGEIKPQDVVKTYDGVTLLSGSKIILRNNPFLDHNFAQGIKINCMVGSQDGFTYAGSGDGVYRTFVGTNNSWKLTGLQNHNVLSICRISNEVFYASTDSGLYYSTDFCYQWKKMILINEYQRIIKILKLDNYIYFLTEFNGVYYSELPEKVTGTIYNPVMIKPSKNEEILPYEVTFKWKSINASSENYILQLSDSKYFEKEKTETVYLTNTFSYKKEKLDSGKSYYWRIKAYNLYGATDWTIPFAFTTK